MPTLKKPVKKVSSKAKRMTLTIDFTAGSKFQWAFLEEALFNMLEGLSAFFESTHADNSMVFYFKPERKSISRKR